MDSSVVYLPLNVTLDHNIWLRYNHLTIWNLRVQKNTNIEKIVQINFLAVQITNQKLSFNIFTVGNLSNIFIDHDLYLIS